MIENKQIQIHIEKQQEGTYFSVPFEMPEKTEQLHLTYHYIHETFASQGNWNIRERPATVDLALVDAGGRLVGASGSSKRQIALSETSSTPGYKAVKLVPGTWAIIVGAYKIPPEGVDVTYNLTFASKTRHWLRGDLHTHTVASDGVLTTSELAQHALGHGLNFLALTDHNSIQPAAALPPVEGLTWINGMEWTHYRGHAGWLGADEPLTGSFHANSEAVVQDLFRTARQKGSLIIINHPRDPDYGFHFDMEQLDFDAIEIWNGPMRESNLQALGLWQAMLASGKKIPAVCGSDYHKDGLFQSLGMPCLAVHTWSAAPEDILEAIRQGRSYMVFAPDGPELSLQAAEAGIGDSITWTEKMLLHLRVDRLQPGDQVRLVNMGGILAEWTAEHDGCLKIDWPVDQPGFIRAEVHRSFVPGLPALPALISNPIYFLEPAESDLS